MHLDKIKFSCRIWTSRFSLLKITPYRSVMTFLHIRLMGVLVYFHRMTSQTQSRRPCFKVLTLPHVFTDLIYVLFCARCLAVCFVGEGKDRFSSRKRTRTALPSSVLKGNRKMGSSKNSTSENQ